MSIVVAEEDSFLKDLFNLFQTEQFKTFQQKHMGNPVEAKTSLMYFELFRAIDKIYREMMDEPMPEDVSTAILRTIMRRRDYRRSLVGTIMQYFDEGASGSSETLQSQLRGLLVESDRLLE